jgi:hypothetical protein
MITKTMRIILVVFVGLAGTAGLVRAQDDNVAGTVLRLQASAVAVQDAVPRALAVGEPIYVGDVLSTGKGARLEVRMIDDAVMTLGERTSFVIIDYVFKDNFANAATRLMNGALLAVSGEIAKQVGNPFEVATEFGTIGIRGTTVWGGFIDGAWGVVLLEGTAVSVENGAGRVDLTETEAGTRITGAKEAPGAVKRWPAQKLERAKKTVSFQ